MITLRAKLVILWSVTGSALGANSNVFSGTIRGSDQNLRPKGAHLTLRSALRLAQKEASARGISPADFEATKFSFSCQNDENCDWTIMYVGKAFTWHGQPAQPSNIPVIRVDDRTRRAHLLGPPPFVDVK